MRNFKFLKGFINDTLIYTSFSFVQKGFTFFITPFLTYYLRPEELGEFTFLQLAWSISVIVCLFGLDETVAKFYIDMPKQRVKIINSAFRLIFYSSLTVIIILFLLAFFNIIPNIGGKFLSLSLLLLWIISTCSYYIYLKILRVTQEKTKFINISSLYTLFQTLVLFLFLLNTNFKALSLLLAYSITSALFGFYSIYKLEVNRNFLSDKPLNKIFHHSIYISLNNTILWLIKSSPLIIVSYISDSFKVIGLYTAVSIFILSYTELSKALSNAIQPLIFEKLQLKDNLIIIKVNNALFLLVFLFTLFIVRFRSFIYNLIINDTYLVGEYTLKLAIICGLLVFMNNIQNQSGVYFHYINKLFFRFNIFISFIYLMICFFFKENITLDSIFLLLILYNLTCFIFREILIYISINKHLLSIFKTPHPYICSYIIINCFIWK